MNSNVLTYILMVGLLIGTAPVAIVVRDSYGRVKRNPSRDRSEIIICIVLCIYLFANWLLIIGVLFLELTGRVSS